MSDRVRLTRPAGLKTAGGYSDLLTGRNILGILALSVFLLFAPAAFADWEFTKWGMSPNQVIAASKGRVNSIPSDKVASQSTFNDITCRAQMPGPYTISDVTFKKVNFCFDQSDRLNAIILYSEGLYDFQKLDRALAAVFGAPAKTGGGSLPERIYNDRQKGNSLRLLGVEPTTILSYRPIPTGF